MEPMSEPAKQYESFVETPMFFRARSFIVASLLVTSVVGAQNSTQPLNSSKIFFNDWIAQSRIVVAGTDFNSLLYQTAKGTGYDGVAALFIERPDGNFICSGSLLAGGWSVLTAAHCLSDASGKEIATKVTTVFFPPGQPAATREIIVSAGLYVNPQYTGQTVDAHDVAIVSLSSAPSPDVMASAYNLFAGNPFGQVGQLVGSGETGTGASGAVANSSGFFLSNRHRALNTVDFSWTDALFGGFFVNNKTFGTADIYGLVADFDSGLPANDATCIITSLFVLGGAHCGLGQGVNEGILGGGDSGGPLFINGQIAGVAAYGVSFGINVGDIDNKLNSSFGEFSGWTSTDYNKTWISQYATLTPEPTSFALVGAGLLGVIGFVTRRAKRH